MDTNIFLPNELLDAPFVDLMNKRIFNVLMIASKYDLFILEDDGRVDEQIFNEYTSLNLRYPPRFTQVSTYGDALKALKYNRFELIICVPNMDDVSGFFPAKQLKKLYPQIPIVLLTSFSREITKTLNERDLSGVDYVFSWLGNTDLLLAIIKLIEDAMNVSHDVDAVGVQTIMIVEDSVRFYSSALPILYKYVLNESKEFSKEALNDHLRMLRMRGRPKILLARNYEEAKKIYNKYGDNMLGVLTDISFFRNGKKDKYAGRRLGKWIRRKNSHIPIIYSSSEIENLAFAQEVGSPFIDKNSKTYPQDLRKTIKNNFGFGDFIISDPESGDEIFRIKNLKDLQLNIFRIPDDALHYHLSRNHFSRFFFSRAMFQVAKLLRNIDVTAYRDMDEARQVIYDTIVKYRHMKNSGVVAIFQKDRFDKYSNFARIGDGSMGGKGRGLAFIGNIVKTHRQLNIHNNFCVTSAKTVVLCTDIFDEFMEVNHLYPIALSDLSDEQILKHFLAAKLPKRLISDFLVFLDAINHPIAIRSSSLLEDSQYQPFAGIYSTYMIPNISDKSRMIHLMNSAVKAVYASVFYRDSKAYMYSTHNLIDQEKMAIVMQEVVGQKYGDYFYPAISGVARSINYYPVGDEKSEDGIVNIAMGLGKYVVDGSNGLRFSPLHTDNILQLSTVELTLKETQTHFYALDLESYSKTITIDDGFNLSKLFVADAVSDGPLRYVSSTYDFNDQIIRHGFYAGGRKIISFANILKHDMFPLADTVYNLMRIGQKEMQRPVEIEFAVDIINQNKAVFYALQIRPIVDSKEVVQDDLGKINMHEAILFSNNALGHGVYSDICDIVYLKSDIFSAANNPVVVDEIEKLNRIFIEQDRHYVLVGPGRWGSHDQWLGVPVKWSNISQARIIVESGLEDYRIEPSQGTHFFQNLTSFGVGYFTINPFLEDGGLFDESFLNEQPALFESDFVRHVRFDQALTIKINGKKKIGLVMKPDK